jgi:predicted dehydrogenase
MSDQENQMSSHTPIRVGFIGAGAICRTRHLPGLAKIEGVDVVAVANRSRQSGRKVADDFGIREVMDDWRQLVARDDLDTVFIGTWPYTHREMSVAVLESGKHCFCQARMAPNLDDAKAMAACARQHLKLVNMICPPPMRMPFEPFIRDVLAKGTLGAVTAVRLVSVGPANRDRDSFTWREDVQMSGRQVLAMGIYAETLHAIVGEYESLTAQTSIVIDRKGGHEVKIPQVVTIGGRLTSGALASEIHSGLVADKTTPHDELTIWGLDGTLRYGFGDSIEMAAAGEPLQRVDVPAALQRGWLVERDFIDAVRAANAGESWSVSPDFEEGLAYMRKVEAVHLSAERGQAIAPASL